MLDDNIVVSALTEPFGSWLVLALCSSCSRRWSRFFWGLFVFADAAFTVVALGFGVVFANAAFTVLVVPAYAVGLAFVLVAVVVAFVAVPTFAE
jgi:hypothetical protein